MAKLLKPSPDWLKSFKCDWTENGRLSIERISHTVPACLRQYLASIMPEEWPMALALIEKKEDHCFSDTGISFSCNWSSDEEEEDDSEESIMVEAPSDRTFSDRPEDSVKIFAGPMRPLRMLQVHFLETIKQALEQCHISIKGQREFFQHVREVKDSLSMTESGKEKEGIASNPPSVKVKGYPWKSDSSSGKHLSPEHPTKLKVQHQEEVAVLQVMSMNILLVGCKGNGKSHTGNTILQKEEVFAVDRRGGTQQSQVGNTIVKLDGVSRLMMTVDTPGVSQEMTESEFEELVRAVKMVPEGFDAICLVWDFCRTENEKEKEVQVFQSLHRLFGDGLYEHLVILVTHAQQEDIKELMTGLPGSLKEIAVKANKVVAIENKPKPCDVQELLHMLHELSTKSAKYKASDLSPSCQIPRGTELRISLVGKTGVGKSHTGNVITGKYNFVTSDKATSQTAECEYHTRDKGDREITVLDTPGVFDTGDKKGITQELCRMVTIFHNGLHAVILVMRCGRYTKEEAESVKIFQFMFGDKFLEYTILLFTHRDQLNKSTEEQYVDSAPKHLKEALAKCGGRCVFFNNYTKDVTILKTQVAKLVSLIQGINDSQGRPYSDVRFQAGEKMWEEILHEIEKDPDPVKGTSMEAKGEATKKAIEMDYEKTRLYELIWETLMKIVHRISLIFKQTN